MLGFEWVGKEPMVRQCQEIQCQIISFILFSGSSLTSSWYLANRQPKTLHIFP